MSNFLEQGLINQFKNTYDLKQLTELNKNDKEKLANAQLLYQISKVMPDPCKFMFEKIWSNDTIRKQLLSSDEQDFIDPKDFKPMLNFNQDYYNYTKISDTDQKIPIQIKNEKQSALNSQNNFQNQSTEIHNDNMINDDTFHSNDKLEESYENNKLKYENKLSLFQQNNERSSTLSIFEEDKGIISNIDKDYLDNQQNLKEFEDKIDSFLVPMEITEKVLDSEKIKRICSTIITERIPEQCQVRMDKDLEAKVTVFMDKEFVDVEHLRRVLGINQHKQFDSYHSLFNNNMNMNNYLIKYITKDNRVSRCSMNNVISELSFMVQSQKIVIPTFWLLSKYQLGIQQFRFSVRDNKVTKQQSICKTSDVQDLKWVKLQLVKWFNKINREENRGKISESNLKKCRQLVCQIQSIRTQGIDPDVIVKEEIYNFLPGDEEINIENTCSEHDESEYQ